MDLEESGCGKIRELFQHFLEEITKQLRRDNTRLAPESNTVSSE
jgi:hypothetical protein